ncbi:carboxymuconolactone decarboxylase family protein [Desulfonema magnum]|nr:carboxymuconolactone decarboxylase family protein [Desulfonema magnum]
MDKSERYKTGWDHLKLLDAAGAEKVCRSLNDIAPDMERFIVEFAYGDIYSRPGLDLKCRQIATIAALTAMGNAEPQLLFHINAALNVGCSPEEIVEIMYATTVFSGFPAGLNGIAAAKEVFETRGITVKQEQKASSGEESRRERGLRTLAAVSHDSGKKVFDSLADIAPDMAEFIINFSYGDVISREGLPLKLKEIAILAVCVARGTMTRQFKLHVQVALNVGCTREEIVELIMQMAVYSGFPSAINGLIAAREIFEANRK